MKVLNYTFLLLLTPLFSAGQVNIDQQVTSTAGGQGSAGNVHLSWTVGEAVTTTLTSGAHMLTQGFHQPVVIESMRAFFTVYPSSCRGSDNGAAAVQVLYGSGPYSYSWAPSVSTSDTASGLSPGEYTVVVTDAEGQMDTVVFTVAVTLDEGCEIHIYSGITPNGDGNNDSWIIDNIQTYPENSVQIFNRWGDRVWSADNYDNQSVLWTGQNGKGGELTEGTYFYIVTIPDNQFTGWVEITR